jgi:hypothetical protein
LNSGAFAIATSTIEFASARLRVTAPTTYCVSPLSRLNGQYQFSAGVAAIPGLTTI